MLETTEQSADLKMALKHGLETPELAALAAGDGHHEADEAIREVEDGADACETGSWVANVMAPTSRADEEI
jgi:hypothetical protein